MWTLEVSVKLTLRIFEFHVLFKTRYAMHDQHSIVVQLPNLI